MVGLRSASSSTFWGFALESVLAKHLLAVNILATSPWAQSNPDSWSFPTQTRSSRFESPPADPSDHHIVQHNLALFKKKIIWFWKFLLQKQKANLVGTLEKKNPPRKEETVFPDFLCKVFLSENASFVKSRHFEEKRIVFCQNFAKLRLAQSSCPIAAKIFSFFIRKKQNTVGSKFHRKSAT